MSRPEEVAAQLDAAIHGLQEIRRIVCEGGREAFDASDDRSRALAFCWERPQALPADDRAPQGAPPLSAPIRFRDRLAHQRLDKLDLDPLWEGETSSDS